MGSQIMSLHPNFQWEKKDHPRKISLGFEVILLFFKRFTLDRF
jgi:hypothetical protein